MPNEGVKLKPCPFCGGEAKAMLGYILYLDEEGRRCQFEGDEKIWFGACVYCPKCGCEIERKKMAVDNTPEGWHDQIKQDAVDAWNRRAKDAD